MNRIAITVAPRLHITLLSMGASGYRRNGGLGFAIEGFETTVIAERNSQCTLIDERSTAMSASELTRHAVWLDEIRMRCGWEGARIVLQGDAAPHVGLGTGTAIRLATVEALGRLNGRIPIRDEVVALSQRGGASGVGINTYFDGGLVFDLGVRATGRRFASSETVERVGEVPPRLGRIDMPAWRVGVCIPSTLRVLSVEEEQDFFDRTCPIRDEAMYEATYHALFGCYSAVAEGDITTFSSAIRAIQQCEWKQAERALYGAELSKIEAALYDAGACCVGMSSLGPTLFFLLDQSASFPFASTGSLAKCQLKEVAPRNHGRVVHA